VFVCNSGRSFSAKLAEIQEAVTLECTPILALFDVDSDSKHDHLLRLGRPKSNSLSPGPAGPSPASLQRQLTFSSEADESYGLQLLSRIASDLQVDEGVKLVIPVALVRMRQKNPTETTVTPSPSSCSDKDSPTSSNFEDKPSPIDPHMMLKCLDAGALDVVTSPLNNEKIMGLTVHAYRIYKTAKKERSAFLASASKFVAAAPRRKQSWVGVEDEKPYAYLREAMYAYTSEYCRLWLLTHDQGQEIAERDLRTRNLH
jgi:3',5'-cyclic-nucleotide phosphodiesterase